jgi:Protein of unknown function (DUF1631)
MSVNADQVFQECVKDALSQAHLLINQVVNTVMDTFETRAIDAITNKERQRYHDLLIELRRSKATLSRSFIAQFSSLVETSGQPNGKPKQALEYGDINLDNITLMDDSSMQEDVEVSQLIQLIESKAEWEIRDLNSRCAPNYLAAPCSALCKVCRWLTKSGLCFCAALVRRFLQR